MAQVEIHNLPALTTLSSTDVFPVDEDQGAGVYITKHITIANSGILNKWNLNGNAGTNPATNFIGTTDNIDFTIKTNSIARAWFLNSGNITIGTATTNAAPIHFNGLISLFQTSASTSGITADKQLNFDSSTTTPSAAFATADTGSWRLFHRTPTNINGGASIRLGNDNDASNENGISFLVGTATDTSPAGKYLGHFTSNREFIIGMDSINVLGLTVFADRGKLHVIGKGSTAATSTFILQNSSGVKSLQVTDDGSVFNLGAASNNATTAFGKQCLISNTTGVNNTAYGYQSLLSNLSGSYNTAFGLQTLANLSSGTENVAIGDQSQLNNISGSSNTSIGAGAMRSITGSFNTAIGYNALNLNSTGLQNTAIGKSSLALNLVGSENTAIGENSLYNNTGSSNVALGFRAGFYETGSNKLFIDNQTRAGEADARVKALVYGIFNASTASQELHINAAHINVDDLPVGRGSVAIGELYADTAANILANSDYVIGRKV